MSKRQEIRAARQRARMRSRILVIGLVTLGALLIGYAFILPMINTVRNAASETPDANAATPITPRVINATVDGQHLGDPNAPVKIDVWEDFQCPSCKVYSENQETLIIKNYVETGQVYYTFHFFTSISSYSPGNTESEHSANAAMCAADQGKFWDYHDILFANWNGENQGAFADYRLVAFAESLGLNMNDFNACFEADRYADYIAQDMQAGQTLGVHGTPAIFMNGQLVQSDAGERYVAGFTEISRAIEAALAGK